MTGTLKTTLIQNPSSADVNITLGTAGQVTLAKSPVLNGSTSGTLTLAAPAIAGTNTITFPAATDTVATLAATQTLTNKTIQGGTIQGGAITSGTAVTLTTQTVVEFTSIPSWVKRVTMMFSGVSGSGTSQFLVQIGSSSFQTSGYVSSASAGTGAVTQTTGFAVTQTVTAATNQSGIVSIVNFNSNTWVMSSNLAFSNASTTNVGGGTVSLSGVLDRIRLTTVNGTDTFDAGSINIMYE